MTRDTRIGLLVGLLFILAFGLILSELTNPELPPPEEPPVIDDGMPRVYQPVVERDRYVVERTEDGYVERDYVPRERAPVPVAEVRYEDDPPRIEPERDASLMAVVPPVRELTLDELERMYGSGQADENVRRTYVVQRGDTLTGIARRMMGDGSRQTVDRLYQANSGWIADPDNIPVGVELVLP